MRTVSLALLLVAASQALCQTPAKETDALQSLLAEVHRLRIAIEAQTAVSQRVQIALLTLQMQDGVVARSVQWLDEAHKKCAALENERQHVEATVETIERGNAKDNEAQAVGARLPEFKKFLEARIAEARTCQTAESDAEVRLRKEQARLTELRDRIDVLDKALEKLATAN